MHDDIILNLNLHLLRYIVHHVTSISLYYFMQIIIIFIRYFDLSFLSKKSLEMEIKISSILLYQSHNLVELVMSIEKVILNLLGIMLIKLPLSIFYLRISKFSDKIWQLKVIAFINMRSQKRKQDNNKVQLNIKIYIQIQAVYQNMFLNDSILDYNLVSCLQNNAKFKLLINFFIHRRHFQSHSNSTHFHYLLILYESLFLTLLNLFYIRWMCEC